MADREIDEQLVWLTSLEIAAGEEAVADEIAQLPRAEVDRLLGLAVTEILDARHDVEKQQERLVRRLTERARHSNE